MWHACCRQQGGRLYSQLEPIAPPLLLWMPADAVQQSFEAAVARTVGEPTSFGGEAAREFLLPYDSAVGAAVDMALRCGAPDC